MTPRIKALYKRAMKDKKFLMAMKSADGDVPGMFDGNLEKTIWATYYYGYLVAKFGDDWEAV